MRGAYFRNFGYGFRGRRGGGWFFPPILLLIGILVLFAVIQSGVWLPLLLIGGAIWLFSPLRRHRWNGDFHRMDREQKHDFGAWHDHVEPAPQPRNDTEYV